MTRNIVGALGMAARAAPVCCAMRARPRARGDRSKKRARPLSAWSHAERDPGLKRMLAGFLDHASLFERSPQVACEVSCRARGQGSPSKVDSPPQLGPPLRRLADSAQKAFVASARILSGLGRHVNQIERMPAGRYCRSWRCVAEKSRLRPVPLFSS